MRVERRAVGVIAWRGMVFICWRRSSSASRCAALGFVGAVFITALIACFASFKMRPLYALALSIVLTVFSTLVFSYGLGLPFERFGPWLRF